MSKKYNEEIDRLKRVVSKLQKEKKTISELLQSTKVSNTSKSPKLSEFKKRVRFDDAKTLAEQLGHCQVKAKNCSIDIAELKEELLIQKEQFSEINDDYSKCNDKLKKLNESHKSTIKLLNDYRNEIIKCATSKREIEKMKKDFEEEKIKHDEQVARNRELELKIQQMDNDRKASTNLLFREIDKNKRMKKEYDEQLLSLSISSDDEKKQFSLQIKELINELKNKDSIYKQTQLLAIELKSKLNKCKENTLKVQKEYSENIQKRKENAKKLKQSISGDRGTLLKKQAELNNKNKQLQFKIFELEKELTINKSQINNLQEVINNLSNQNEKLKNQYDKSESDIKILNDQIEKLDKRIKNIKHYQTDFDRLTNEHKKLLKKAYDLVNNKNVDKLRDFVNEIHDDNFKGIIKMFIDDITQLKVLQTDKSVLESNNITIRKTIEQYTTKINKLKKEIAECNARIEEFERYE